MAVYYNEIDPQKAAWLRELVRAGVVAPGDVDERSIADVKPAELVGYTQCHFFAGIGVWSYSLRLAGWPDSRPVWTGSCPCPSFSCAGKGTGFDDPRHLWPVWYSLIRECRPGIVFGEQADDAIGYGWLDLISGEMEAAEYAIAAAVLGAHSAGAPHIRQRLYFCAHAANGDGRRGVCGAQAGIGPDRERWRRSASDDPTCSGDNAKRPRLEGHFGDVREWRGPGWLDPVEARSIAEAGATRGFWADCDWWHGRDEKYRPAGPGVQPLASGSPARVLRLRGYGDAIVAPLAAEFIGAAMEVIGV